jgi:hypothetical protein
VSRDCRDLHESVGIAHWQLAECERVEQTENRRVRANRKCQQQKRDDCKRRRLSIGTDGVAEILPQRREERESACLAPRFTRLRQAADPADSGGARGFGCHATRHILLGREFEM